MCWGNNENGQLGTGDWASKLIPTPVTGLYAGSDSVDCTYWVQSVRRGARDSRIDRPTIPQPPQILENHEFMGLREFFDDLPHVHVT
jgi:hypothetical protein